ncbi:MAG TPA: peptidoglycan DD-metalloendopeptidase family protein [Thermoanaerobaculaceae bacterium]|nr:peptidoglycan DD-metalloendopeptidase family protein [Thermoanaerobaculaceae bacterium]
MTEKRHSTIIIVPHAHGKVFKIQLSPVLLKSLAFLGIAVAVLSVVSIVASGNFLRQRALFRALQSENKQLKGNNQRLAQTLTQVQTRLAQFEQRTKALAIAAGVANLFSDTSGAAPAVAGSGGPLTRLAGEPEALVRKQEQLDQQLAKVEKRLSEQALVLSHTPVVAPVVGVITDGFGPRIDPVTHQPAFHDGLDISVAFGTVISAPADGVVTFADRDSGYGRLLKINHGYGYTTMYGHLDRFLVKEGSRVTRGQPIGKVGMSGRTTGPHLHYEVWKDGEKQNPLYYILDAY